MRQFRPTDYIEINPAFVAILCAYYYFDPACTFWPFVSALLFHEAGHLLLLWLLIIYFIVLLLRLFWSFGWFNKVKI